MDSLVRTRVVTTTKEQVIRDHGKSPDKFRVFQNLGPAKIVVIAATSGGDSSNDEIRAGDYVEIYCQSAEVQIASGESYDSAVLQWMTAT